MASLRGHARSASTAAKLATVEQIIGYNFKSVERLYEALDLEKSPITLPTGEVRAAKRTRNTRLALVGDAAAHFEFACQWYHNKDLDGPQWMRIRAQGLSNDTLGKIGFSLGLDELTVPENCEGSYAMASTVEAILGAVYHDGGEEAFKRVMARCGVSHKLLAVPERAWIHDPVKSSRNLPSRFFAGHQWGLQELLFRSNPKLLPRTQLGGVAKLPLNEARVLLEALRARAQARKQAEEEAKRLAEERAKEKAKEKARKEAERLRKEAAKKAEKAEKAKKRADEKAKKDAENEAKQQAKKEAEEIARRKVEDGQPRQKTALWASVKRFWHGSDTMAESQNVNEPNTGAVTDTATNTNTVAESNIATETSTATGLDKVTESETVTDSDKPTESDTENAPNAGKELTEGSESMGSYLLDTCTKIFYGSQQIPIAPDMPLLDPKQRKKEVKAMNARIRALKLQKRQYTKKQRPRRKSSLLEYEAKLEDINFRLDAARASLKILESQKSVKKADAES
ncbi:Translation initiation factor IF-2 [Cytospora mali]|uniref:Translation initiation factor IF-2 n=1 Tax=Cytospora mali TaxID=578113 RepID=A0A194W3M0_CYTMA|nr:Translation initiation factor IF-2 [Valsa mali]